MDEKLESRLKSAHPRLFQASGRRPPFFYGISCGDGWFDLLDVLCGELEQTPLVSVSEGNATPAHPESFWIEQIKEKFGGLRVYVSAAPDYVHNMIRIAEALSFRICENCGRPGRLRSDRAWIRTLCDDCADVQGLQI